MFYAEKLQLFIAAYTAVLACDKTLLTRLEIITEGSKIIVKDDTLDAGAAALQFVLWKVGFGNKPSWM